MATIAKGRIKSYDNSARYYDENANIRGEVTITSNEETTGYEFEPYRDDYPATRIECSCEGKGCSTCGGLGYYFELKRRNLYSVGEGWE